MNVKHAVTAGLIVALVLVIAAVCWYSIGWTQFSYATGDLPAWSATGGDISRLRFKACKFTVDGHTVDVTGVLNRMAIAYAGSQTAPDELKLVAPLNAFSFAIPKYNDGGAAATSPPWCPATTQCTEDSQCPVKPTVAGACSTAGGVCVNCTGGPAVTLAGMYRTI